MTEPKQNRTIMLVSIDRGQTDRLCYHERYRSIGAVDCRRRTALNFHVVEVADRPVMLPSSFCCAVAVAFYLQFFDAVTEKLGLFKC